MSARRGIARAIGVGTFAACALASAEARLPGGVTPLRYAITLAPDLDAGIFFGQETISVRVEKPTRRVVLNSLDLAVADTRVTTSAGSLLATARLDPAQQTLTLELPSEVPAGPAEIALSFRGTLGRKLRGLYLAESEGRRYALTQFESSDARRAFPCFDEPAYKARFQLTAEVATGLTAISNTPPRGRTPDPQRRIDRVEFGETLPMSSYLLALAVGPFVRSDGPRGDRVPIAVFGALGAERLSSHALASARALLPRFEDYFGAPYPYGKLDLVAAPEFAYGGMENVAAIFFRPARLLVDERNAAPWRKRGAVEVLAHEIAHQWFGDLVTMRWWDELWLNEAFATWMEKKVVDGLHPEWHVWRDFTAGRAHSFDVDTLADTRALRAPGLTSDELEAVMDPAITYGKGAAVLRMLERWLGEDAFRRGVQAYVRQHSFGNTSGVDLWRALSAASKKPVERVASAWIAQAGHPVIDLALSCAGGRAQVQLAQGTRSRNAAPGARWPIPVCLRFGDRGPGDERCELLEEPRGVIDLGARPCPAWVSGNAGAAGFYRVHYAGDALPALARAAPGLPPEERIALLQDVAAEALSGIAAPARPTPVARWLDTAVALRGERDPAVLEQIADGLGRIGGFFAVPGEPPAIRLLARELYQPTLDELSWEPRADDDEDARRRRSIAIRMIGHFALEPARAADARARSLAAARDPAALHPALVDPLLEIAALDGDAAFYERLLARARATGTPEERERYLRALATFRSPELAARTLALALTDEVKREEVEWLVTGIEQTWAGRERVERLLTERFDEVARRTSDVGLHRVIDGLSAGCAVDEADRIESFFRRHGEPPIQHAVAQAVERIRGCARIRQSARTDLAAWLLARYATDGRHAKP